MNHLNIFKCIFQIFLVFSATNAYKITFKKPNPVSMGSNGPVEIKVVMDSYEEEDNWIGEHSHMTSDVLGVFLTYLPTLIRYFTT